MQMTCSVKMVQ